MRQLLTLLYDFRDTNNFLLCSCLVVGIIKILESSLCKLKIVSSAGRLDSNASNLQVFSYATIKIATKNFSSENKLGEGGFGSVYKVINANPSLFICFMWSRTLKFRVKICFSDRNEVNYKKYEDYFVYLE